MATYLFGDDEGRRAAQRIDRCIDRLPGLTGLHLAEHSIDWPLLAASGGRFAIRCHGQRLARLAA